MVNYLGWVGPQDPEHNGIRWSNIAPKLTPDNWEEKAVLRDSLYLWITEGSTSSIKKLFWVHIYADDGEVSIDRRHFLTLEEAINWANGLSDKQGKLPDLKVGPLQGWIITTRNNPRKRKETSK
jgi:hypothetical protein